MILTAAGASIIGRMIGYVIGREFGYWLLLRYGGYLYGVVIVLLVIYASFLKKPLAEIIPLVLTAVLASIPVALPATFTLASADRVSTLRRSPQGPRRSG